MICCGFGWLFAFVLLFMRCVVSLFPLLVCICWFDV